MIKYVVFLGLLILGLSSCHEAKIRSSIHHQRDEEYCDTLRSWGAADAYINDENILLYGAYKGSITGDADKVAQLWYEDAVASGIKDLEGCQVIELPDYKVLGSYRP